MNVKPSSMPMVAAGLAVLVLLVGVSLWTSPWKEDTTGAATAGGTKTAVKVDEALSNEGKTLAESNGCTSCHTIDGGSGAGPTWAGLWGAQGATLGKTVDTAYVVSILKTPPAAMASYQGKFNDADGKAVAEYIKSLAQ